MKSHIVNNKAAEVKMMLESILSSYQSEYKIVDYLYAEEAGQIVSDNSPKNMSNKVINI